MKSCPHILFSISLGIIQNSSPPPWAGAYLTASSLQIGLTAILGPNPSPSQLHDLTLRARCFYLSRKKSIPIDFDGYKAYLASKSTLTPDSTIIPNSTHEPKFEPQTTATMTNEIIPHHEPGVEQKTAPYPPTFAQIVALITSNSPIPGIKEIPPTVLTDYHSEPVLPKRRKPWEKNVPEEVIQGKAGGTFGDRRDEIVEQELPDA